MNDLHRLVKPDEPAEWEWGNRQAQFCIQLLSADPVDEELWVRIVHNPEEVFIGLQDAGRIKGNVQLRCYERISNKQHDSLRVEYFIYP